MRLYPKAFVNLNPRGKKKPQSCVIPSLCKHSIAITHSVYKCLCNTLHGLDTGPCLQGVLGLLGLLEIQENLEERMMGYACDFSEILSVWSKRLSMGHATEVS